jgi:hypothetical protein
MHFYVASFMESTEDINWKELSLIHVYPFQILKFLGNHIWVDKKFYKLDQTVKVHSIQNVFT